MTLGVIGERHVAKLEVCPSGVQIGIGVHLANTVGLTKPVEHIIDVLTEQLITPTDSAGYVELETDLIRRHGEPG